MSLSKFFKDQGEFKPAQLVAGSASGISESWHHEDLAVSQAVPAPAAKNAAGDNEISSVELSAEPVMPRELDDATPPQQYREAELTVEPAEADEEPPGIEQPPMPPPIDIDALREEAYQEGLSEGRRQAEEDFGSTAAALVQVCEQLNSIRETILKNSKGEIVELVLALSEKIIRHSLAEQDTSIVATVEEAIHQAVKSSEFYIYLNPDDIAAVKERARDLVADVNGLDNIVIKAEKGIERGGCRIESDNCTVDATIASQLQVIRARIQEER